MWLELLGLMTEWFCLDFVLCLVLVLILIFLNSGFNVLCLHAFVVCLLIALLVWVVGNYKMDVVELSILWFACYVVWDFGSLVFCFAF